MTRTSPPPLPPSPSPRSEQACEIVGDAVARLLPAPATMPADAALAARLERALTGEGGGRAAPAGRRAFRWPVFAGVALAGAAAVAVVAGVRLRPLGYEVTGAMPDGAGRLATAAGGAAAIRFSDGTAISLRELSAGRIGERTRDGATFTLEGGRASFAVVHRPGARWLVEAGPFQIAVTGTRFDVQWSAERGGLEVRLREGSVMVRGALAGKGVALRAGQRLIADAARDELTVESAADDAAPAPAPVAPAGVAPAAPHAEAPLPVSPSAPPVAPRPAARPSSPPSSSPSRAAAAAAVERRQRRHEAAGVPARVPEDLMGSTDDPALALGAPKRELLMGAGGSLCSNFIPQFSFEKWTEGFVVASKELLALRNRSLDREHSWCGDSSLRIDADFNPGGTPNAAGALPYQTGQVMVRLGQPVDLGGKLVVMHVYVDAPARVQFGVQVFAINTTQGKWVAGGVDSNIAPGRWWTVRASFEGQAPQAGGGPPPLAAIDGLAFQIYSTGAQRTWTGTVFIDDVGWK